MLPPPFLTVTPYKNQLKGAAQMDYLCKSSSKGGILADGPGLGKTLTAILSMWLVKDEPGLSMVAVPNILCHRWVREIEGSFQAVSTPYTDHQSTSGLNTNITGSWTHPLVGGRCKVF